MTAKLLSCFKSSNLEITRCYSSEYVLSYTECRILQCLAESFFVRIFSKLLYLLLWYFTNIAVKGTFNLDLH